jgi:glycosyltransferase involved in cell wall biosynthesis
MAVSVSVVVPTYNRRDQLSRSLDALLSLEYEDYEVCVVNDGSTDGTRAYLDDRSADAPHLRVVHQENQGVAAARNRGIAETDGEYVFFTDDDCVVPDDWVEAHLRRYEEYGVDGVNGRQWPIEMNYVEAFKVAMYWDEHETTEVWSDPDSVKGATTNNLSYRREVIDEVGGFDESMRRGSDPEHSKRVLEAGFSVLNAPDLRVGHQKRDTLFSYLRNSYRQGKGRSVREEKHGGAEHNPRGNWSYRFRAWRAYYEHTGPAVGWAYPVLAVLSTGALKLGELSGGW